MVSGPDSSVLNFLTQEYLGDGKLWYVFEH